MRHWILLAGFAVAAIQAAPVQDPLTSRVDQIFKAYDRQDSPGCSVGVYRDGKIAYARGYGMADLEAGVPIGTNTVFDIGSTSKQFTAASILLLAQRGKLALDDDVRKFIPELPRYQKPITVRHLLHHTSGLRDYIGLLNLMGHSSQGHTTAKQALDAIVRQKALNFEPGAEFLYSNSGYFLLAQIVERVAGQSLRAFAQENLFAPLGMRSTYFHDDHRLVVPNRATGYARASSGFSIAMSNWEQTGDGAVNTTVEDLLRWDQNFYDQKIGGKAMLTDFLARGRLNDGTTISYAGGLMTGTFRGLNIVSHGGSWAGYRAELVRFPDHQLSVATLCNLASANPTVMARAVAAVYLEEKLAPLPPPADPDSLADAASPAPVASPAPEAAPPMTEPLASYAGAYYSEELDRTFTLTIDDGRLVLRREGTSPMTVRRLPNHAFGGDGFSMRFSPDAQGRMTAFELNMGRVRGIRFVRTAESR